MSTTTSIEPTSFLELALEVDDRVAIEVEKGFLHGFREDTITENIVAGLREVLRKRVVFSHCQSYDIECEAFKLSGKPEHHHGDIAFIIRRSNRSGLMPEGVGYMEAKLRSRKSGNFEAFDPDQISRIYLRSPHALVLPYDYDPPLVEYPDIVFPYEYLSEERVTWPVASPLTPVIPMSLVAKQQALARDLYTIALPIGYQIIHRYIRGFDLDYVSPPEGISKTFKARHPSPWVMVITVSDERSEGMDTSFDSPGYNPLETSDEEGSGDTTEDDATQATASKKKRLRFEDDDREEGFGLVH